MTTSNSARAEKMTNTLASGLAGCLVWWDFEQVRVTPQDALRVVTAHGLEQEISVPSVTDEQAIRATVGDFHTGRSRDNRWRAEIVGDYADGTLEVALLKHVTLSREKSAAEKVAWEQRDAVVFDRHGRSWLYAGASDAASAFVTAADERRGFLTHEWVKDVVMAQISAMGAFPLRRRVGGFFFVPAANVEQLTRLAAMIKDLPADIYLNVAEIAATDGSAASIGRAAQEHLAHGLGSLKERLAAWRELQRVPRADALDNAMAEFVTLRQQAELYRDALSLEIGDVEEEIETAVAVASGLMGLAAKGLPEHFVSTVRSLHAAFGDGVEIPYSSCENLGLPENAHNHRAQNWWTRSRGQLAAEEAGLKAAATPTGVTLTRTLIEDVAGEVAA